MSSLPPTTQATLPDILDKPVIKTRDERLRERRQEYFDSDDCFYLGDTNLRQQVKWKRDGKAHKLVCSNPTLPTASQGSSSDIAVLTAVVLISPEDYWFTSDGMWRGGTTITPTLDKVKPTCTGGSPEDCSVFKDDFKVVIENLRWLQDQVVTHGFSEKRGLLVGSPVTPRIKVRHVLFEVSTVQSFLYSGTDVIYSLQSCLTGDTDGESVDQDENNSMCFFFPILG
jgi:hypothetical protein